MKPEILKRLTRQMAARGVKNAESAATTQLQKFGILHKGSTQLTQKGEVRNAMSPGERAIDRASKYSGKNARRDYTYNPDTNRATLKTKKGNW